MAQSVQCSFQRVEKKYLLTQAQYAALSEGMRPYLRRDEYGRYTICNLYYDTDDFRLIRASLEKPVYKEKLRLRSYGVPTDTDKVFVELKKKFDGVVYKRRTVLECARAAAYLSGGACPLPGDQICREIDWFLGSYPLSPKVFLAYEREALAGADDPQLRVTFDTGLRWRTDQLDLRFGDQGDPLLMDGKILMEIKIPGAAPLWLSHLLSEAQVYPTSFSKYGLCYRQNLMGWEPAPVKKEDLFCA
jgi:hypothetical protein